MTININGVLVHDRIKMMGMILIAPQSWFSDSGEIPTGMMPSL